MPNLSLRLARLPELEIFGSGRDNYKCPLGQLRWRWRSNGEVCVYRNKVHLYIKRKAVSGGCVMAKTSHHNLKN